jgi:MTH538 TIR-like domain (DUF1863)
LSRSGESESTKNRRNDRASDGRDTPACTLWSKGWRDSLAGGDMKTLQEKLVYLRELALSSEARYGDLIRLAVAARQAPPVVRHKVFVSYHGADIDAVTTFVETFGDVFIPRVIGASDSDDFKDPVDSKDEDYIKRAIRERYLTDSTVTLVYVGSCTRSRKYVDWEISSTLRNDSNNKRSGLLGIAPPGVSVVNPPDRLEDNTPKGDKDGYARLWRYPSSAEILRQRIDDAFHARDLRSSLVKNSRELRKRNGTC